MSVNIIPYPLHVLFSTRSCLIDRQQPFCIPAGAQTPPLTSTWNTTRPPAALNDTHSQSCKKQEDVRSCPSFSPDTALKGWEVEKDIRCD